MKKKLVLALIVVGVLSYGLLGQSLNLKKFNYKPGESITLHFDTAGKCQENGWIGIIPASVAHGKEAENDKHDLTYQYVKKMKKGKLVFKAPSKSGLYDFRMNSTDSNGVELTHITFSVYTDNDPVIMLKKTVFKPGEKIDVQYAGASGFPGNAWIGIVPAKVPHGKESENDKHDLSYKYLNKKASGKLTFTAPSKAGKYTFRMNNSDSNGKEVAFVVFVVK